MTEANKGNKFGRTMAATPSAKRGTETPQKPVPEPVAEPHKEVPSEKPERD